MANLGWHAADDIGTCKWTCGYCGKQVGGKIGYRRETVSDHSKRIYICPHCENPTAFLSEILDDGEYGPTIQIPGEPYGSDVMHVPSDVAALYAEVRRCVQYTAYTAAVLAMRKLLMHVAVECGAEENQQFVKYVDYLDSEHYIPPSARDWVDTLRTYGNDATHQIVLMNEGQAKRLLDFAEMLLKLVYEFPAKNITV